MKPHLFVALPYGDDIHCDTISGTLMPPARAGTGVEVFCADEAKQAGDLGGDLLQERRLADLIEADKALGRLMTPLETWKPRKIFLFSGHMIDKPGRQEPRFPADKEPLARQAIEATLDALQAAPEDLALCGGACGGDLLFAEACLTRGLKLEIRIALDEPTFLQESVLFAGNHWRERYYQVKENARTTVFTLPERLTQLGDSLNPYELNNLWQLYTALAWGPEKLDFICLWDGKNDDGKGGTKHMYDTVRQHNGRVHHLNTTKLW